MIRRILLLWLLVASATSHSLAISRPTAYGAVPGYRPVAFGNGVDLAQSSAWRGREVDVTGYYHLGLRDYDPVSGQWLSYDPMWNAVDPNGQSFCGGDPVNGFDSSGKCVENLPVNVNISINPNANLGPWLVAPGTDSSLLPQPYVNPAQPFTFTAYFPNDVAFQQNMAGVGQVVDTTAQVAGVVVPFVLTDGASAVAEEEAADEVAAADTSGAVASTEATTAASTSRTMTVNPDPYSLDPEPLAANTGATSTAQQTGTILWSGPGAKDAATWLANNTGGTTLEMTQLGAQTELDTDGMDYLTQAKPIWEAASQQFVQNASGEVTIVLSQSANPSSIYFTTEWQALLQNPNVNGVKFIIIP